MKKHFLLSVLCLGAYLSTSTAQAGYSTYDTTESPYMTYEDQQQGISTKSPGLSFKPSQLTYELQGNMPSSRGKGHADIQTVFLLAKLIEQDSTATFAYGLDFIGRMTWLHSNAPEISTKELYSVGVNLSASYALGNPETRLFGGLTTSLNSDFHTLTSDSLQFGARGGVSFRVNDGLTMQAGIYFSPQLASFPLIPLICFQYSLNDQWKITLDPLRLRFINTVSDTFSWAPFVGFTGGSWNIKEHDRHYRFATLSGVAGIQTNWKLGQWGSYKPVLMNEVGFSFSTRMDTYSANGRHHLARTNFDPGFFLQTGIKLEF